MIYPSVVKNFNVYPGRSGGGRAIGLADIVLPKLVCESDTVKGAGLAGSLKLGVIGNLQPMETTLSFHANTVQSLEMFIGQTQDVRCLSSVQMFDTNSGQFDEYPEEIDMRLLGASYDPGRRDASTKGQITMVFDCLILTLIFGGKKYWELDPFNDVCVINGVDLNQGTRANT